MKALATGGRDYADRKHAIAWLDAYHEQTPISLLIQGGASGADLIAKEWAMSRGVHYATVPALWDAHGKAAGPKRNQAMLQLLPHVVIAFPGGKGTADMVRRAIDSGIRVVRVSP